MIVVRHVQPKKHSNKSHTKQVNIKQINTKQVQTNTKQVNVRRNTPAIVKRKSVTVHIGETWPIEQQEILSILMDAGQDWKPRDKNPSQQYIYIQPPVKQQQQKSNTNNHLKTQPTKIMQATKHIHAVHSQPRAKLAI